MFKLNNLQPKEGSKKKAKRVARGPRSGHGKTACRGHKGQKSRSGGVKGAYFEGGQTPLYRRLPKKRGFKNYPFSIEYQVINVGDLEKYNGEISLLAERKLIKVLGNGEVTKALKVTANAFSKSAKEKIEKSGGQCIVAGQS